MINPIDFMNDALHSMMRPGKIIIEKEERSLEVKFAFNNEDPILLSMMLMKAMTQIAKRSDKHKFSIAAACEQVLDDIKKEADHEKV